MNVASYPMTPCCASSNVSGLKFAFLKISNLKISLVVIANLDVAITGIPPSTIYRS